MTHHVFDLIGNRTFTPTLSDLHATQHALQLLREARDAAKRAERAARRPWWRFWR